MVLYIFLVHSFLTAWGWKGCIDWDTSYFCGYSSWGGEEAKQGVLRLATFFISAP